MCIDPTLGCDNVPYLVSQLTQDECLGDPNGKSEGFAYAMSSLSVARGVETSLLDQLKAIHSVARAFNVRIPQELIFIDMCAGDCSTRRNGLERLLVAARSVLFDADKLVVQSLDRLSRMPDEQEALSILFKRWRVQVLTCTQMPAASFADVDVYLKHDSIHSLGSGFLK